MFDAFTETVHRPASQKDRKPPVGAAARLVVGLIALILGLSGVAVASQDAILVVPPDVQAALFQKIFGYAPRLAGATPTVYLVYDEELPEAADELAEAFERVSIPFEALHWSDLQSVRAPAVVYRVSNETSAVASFCEEQEILTISGNSRLARDGDVSIGLAEADRRPEIVVHMGRLAVERQELRSDLLALATIVGRD